AFDLSRNLILGLIALIYLHQVWVFITKTGVLSTTNSLAQSSIADIISPIFYILFWYVLLAAPVFHAWYLLWFLPLAILIPSERAYTITIIFAATALLIIPYFETVRVWLPYLLTNQFVGHLIGVPLLIGPPLILFVWPKLFPIRLEFAEK
ncbi:MAG: hypothetical protein AAF485_11895, partial [Chloroflexota bacterium]